MMSKGRYLRGVDSEISVKNLFRYYKTICPQFYTELREDLKPQLTYRSNRLNYWGEKELLKKNCKHAKVKFDNYEKKLFDVAIESNITVCSYLSTTFMELLIWNIPVILFTPFDKEGYNKETIENFKLLKKNNMFFDNYKDAAKFINSQSDNIHIWWNSKNVQNCRKKFLNDFSAINYNLVKDIQNLIRRA